MSLYQARLEKMWGWMAEEEIALVMFEDAEDRRDATIRWLTGHPGDALLFLSLEGTTEAEGSNSQFDASTSTISDSPPVSQSNPSKMDDASTMGDSPQGSSAGAEGSPQDLTELKTLLAKLKLALETFDAGTMKNTMDTLFNLSLADDVEALVQNISNNILMAEYDEALARTESLLIQVNTAA